MPYSTTAEIDKAHSTLRKTFQSGKTKSLAWRKWQLKQVWWLTVDNAEEITAALHTDLHRHKFETNFLDIPGVKNDVLLHLSKLEEWAADEIPQDAGLIFGTFCRARIRREPLGVALILSAWNFPFAIMLQPVIAAISAGCCCLLKPSEIASATEKLLVDLIPKYMDPEAIQIVTGGAQETGLILEKRFDQIFYTGSYGVGKIIQSAAAKNLTPTVLELGGQCPCIVTKSASIDLAAKRIAFSKFLNAGQICLSANHVFVDPAVYDEFIQRATFWINEFSEAKNQSDMVRIISDRQYDRIADILAKSNGKVLAGGKSKMDKSSKYIPPTLITDVNMQDSTMAQEIFGPLLPVLKVDYQSACTTLQSMEHPLGLYIFSNDQSEIDTIISRTASGGVTINDVMFHAAIPNAPFGGVGQSGTGAYHGKYGFEAFSHRRAIANVPGWLDHLVSFKYPPYKTSNISKVPAVQNPGFKRGETIADQVVSSNDKWIQTQRSILSAGKQLSKLALAAVVFAWIDARFGGESRLIGLLRNTGASVRARLPLI